jgi:hypothetical protein
MSMFDNFEHFDLMEWLNQGMRAGIDFSQLGRMQPPGQNPQVNPRQPETRMPHSFIQDQGQMPPRPPQVDPRQHDGSRMGMLNMLTNILSNFPDRNLQDTGGDGGWGDGIEPPRPQPPQPTGWSGQGNDGPRPQLHASSRPRNRVPPRPQSNVLPRSIPYERRATDNYEGFYSTPYAPLREGMTKEDLGKIIAGNLGASAGFK